MKPVLIHQNLLKKGWFNSKSKVDKLDVYKLVSVPVDFSKLSDVVKEIDIKNRSCYYLDNIINGTDINFSDILLDGKLYENISVFDIWYKTSAGSKLLRIRFDKIDGLTIALDCKIKHLKLFDYGLLNKICDKIKYLKKKWQMQILKKY